MEETNGGKKKTKNTAPFTIWTTPENVRKWKAYQKAKKAALKTQNDFVVAAITAYMKNNPITDKEIEKLQEDLKILEELKNDQD